jgi:hypothetical protein
MERGCAREHRSQTARRAKGARATRTQARRCAWPAFAAGVFDSTGVFREHMRSSRPLTRSADRAARLARLDITTVLPAELLVWIAGSLSPKDLCRVACTHSMWREAVAVAAERRVREYLRTTLVLEASPCWLRSLAQIERLTAAVGSRPEHGWRQEWKAMKISAAKLSFMTGGREWKAEYEADFDDGGVLSLEREIELSRPQCLLAPELHGCWDEEAALYVTSIAGGEESLILCEAFEQRTAVFAALLHAELSAYSSAACVAAAQSYVPPPLYVTLTGAEDSLMSYNFAWCALPELAIGAEFRANASAGMPTANTFPDEQGMFFGEVKETGPEDDDFEVEWTLVDSDIVRFVSRPADCRGYHAFVQDMNDDNDDVGWSVPHDSVMRLEAISEAGAWTVRGLLVRRRLYTVSVSFG